MADASRPLTQVQRRNDVLLAAAVCVGALISTGLSSVAGFYGEAQAALPLGIAYCFALAAPLALRRRWPSIVAIVVSVVYFVGVTVHIPELYAGNIAVFIAFYTVGAWSSDRRLAAIVRIAIIVGMAVWLFVVIFIEATAPTEDGLSRAGVFSPFLAYMLINVLFNVLFFGGAYFFGDRAWASAQQRLALEQRTADLERERERTAAQAVALDRVRIARELHDVVAHHVSLMGVQAGAARAVMTKDPDAARATLEGVEASARTALTELRQLLETLRAPGEELDEDAEVVATGPTTIGLAGLPALVAEAEAAGLPATFSVVGEPMPVSATIGVNLFRIAQEALTNARRHAGPGATADVRLRYGADSVELEVANTGRRVPPAAAGLGLLGMRERAAASGGHLEAGPRDAGGYLVRASAPLRAEAHV